MKKGTPRRAFLLLRITEKIKASDIYVFIRVGPGYF